MGGRWPEATTSKRKVCGCTLKPFLVRTPRLRKTASKIMLWFDATWPCRATTQTKGVDRIPPHESIRCVQPAPAPPSAIAHIRRGDGRFLVKTADVGVSCPSPLRGTAFAAAACFRGGAGIDDAGEAAANAGAVGAAAAVEGLRGGTAQEKRLLLDNVRRNRGKTPNLSKWERCRFSAAAAAAAAASGTLYPIHASRVNPAGYGLGLVLASIRLACCRHGGHSSVIRHLCYAFIRDVIFRFLGECRSRSLYAWQQQIHVTSPPESRQKALAFSPNFLRCCELCER